MKILVIAEGVARRSELTLIRSLGISHAQGFELGRPRATQTTLSANPRGRLAALGLPPTSDAGRAESGLTKHPAGLSLLLVKEFFRVLGLLVLLGIAFLAYPLVFLASRFLPSPERRNWRLLWQGMGCRWALAYLRCRVNVQGTPPHRGMLVSNHQGYMDILVLGSLDPASFVAKAEIRWWPIFGLFSWWAGTIFLERRNKTALKGPLHETIERLREGGRERGAPD
ncbi:MAG: EAL domain-containing protein, partial [Betaproteobacteria bacterium]|nr:EAL domain-containing protein [Betaproteobacteria bacterium]